MRLGVLFSGGKDSCYALYKASKKHEIACLLTIESQNPDSYMFHTPNTRLTELQAKSLKIPILAKTTRGEKEKELEDLKELIKEAKEEYRIQGIVTGAIQSVYQSSRVQKICDELKLQCINPLWQKDQIELLNEIVREGFEVIITRVSAYPLGKELLGKAINQEMISRLKSYEEKYKINPAGEGGEIETFVVDMPLFRKRIEIKKAKKEYADYNGFFIIEEAKLR